MPRTSTSPLLQQLIEGNQRYASEKAVHPRQGASKRLQTAQKQTPFAVILGCADSRVSPELIFDQGIGDLFVIRVAGQVAGPLELESLHFAVAQLGAPLVVVLGHEKCGAVSAVFNGQTEAIPELAAHIYPTLTPHHSLNDAITAHVQHVVGTLKTHPLFTPLVDQNKLIITGGVYQLASGLVSFLSH